MASRSFAASTMRSTEGMGCGAVCGVLRTPVLRALAGASWTASLAMAPGLKNRGTQVEDNKIEKSTKHATKTKPKFTYPDRALMLRFLVALLRARGAVPPLEDCPEGAPLVSAW